MSPTHKIPPDPDLARLIAAGRDMIHARRPDFAGRWVLVDVFGQRLVLVRDSVAAAVWPVSTSRAGLDNRQDSGGTPPGLHRIDRKIGAGAEPGMIFSNRQPTGILWRPDSGPKPADDLILTRVLTLDGLQDGLNRGPGIDSRARFIYIHGTNHEDEIGSPVSGGCVRMTSGDVIELFDLVEQEDPVVII